MSKTRFGNNADGTMSCPNCGEGYLHHDSVTVFARPQGEDSETLAVKIDARTGEIAWQELGVPQRNPSDRRHGLTISFTCEQCDHEVELHVAQHKGVTLLSTETFKLPVSKLGPWQA